MANFVRAGIPEFYIGNSGDTKPTGVPVGSRCYELDTGIDYITKDGTNWVQYVPNIYFGTITVTGDILSSVDGGSDLGDPTHSFGNVYFDTAIYGGSVSGNWHPDTNNAADLGDASTPKRWRGVHGQYASLTLSANVNANSQTINAAPAATVITAVNTKSFTGTLQHLVIPAITPAANGGGITLTGLGLSQGAIANVADSEAITVKGMVITGAAGAVLATGVYTWSGIDVTIPGQAANGAINVATGLKITGGTKAGAATATMRGIDITMAAVTDVAINIVTGIARFADGSAAAPSICIASDPDNGLYLAGANQLGVALAGAAKLLYSAGVFAFQEATAISTPTGTKLSIQSFDTGVGLVNVAQFVGAADPYVLIGRDDTGVATNAVTDMLVLQAGAGTNNEAASFGCGMSIKLGNSASELEERASLDWYLIDATNGAEYSGLRVNLMIGGTMYNTMSFINSGLAFMQNAFHLDAANADNGYMSFYARGTGTSLVEIFKMTGGVNGGTDAYVTCLKKFVFPSSLDSAAVADEVSLGGYEISAGHRALAISSEEAVVAETDETKFSHKLPVRINGATYNIMLCDT
jgi:hypothetical protein